MKNLYEKEINSMKHIIGLKIIGLEEFNDGHYNNGIKILLENGEYIIGQDGEYGTNVIELKK